VAGEGAVLFHRKRGIPFWSTTGRGGARAQGKRKETGEGATPREASAKNLSRRREQTEQVFGTFLQGSFKEGMAKSRREDPEIEEAISRIHKTEKDGTASNVETRT